MLAVCSSCETDTIDVTSFDLCKANLTTFDLSRPSDENNYPLWNGTYEDLKGELVLVDSSKSFSATMGCNKSFPDFPNLHLRLQTSERFASLSAGEESAVYHTDQSTLFAEARQVGPAVALKYCVYTSPELYGSKRVNSTSLMNATCFTSSTDLYEYQNREKMGQINGSVTRCNLHYCAHHYDSISILNGQKKQTGLTKSPLIFKDRINEETGYWDPLLRFSDLSTWTTESSNEIDYITQEMSHYSLVQEFLRSANSTPDPGLDFFDSKLGNGSALNDFTQLFDAFASAMTSTIQSSANPNSTAVPMEVYDSNIFVEVRWRWMIMPLSVVFIGLLFLVLSILESWNKDYLLKTSILAVMFYGLDTHDWKNNDVGDMEGVSRRRALENNLTKEAEKIRVAFVHNEDGQMKLKKE
jgi:hypothetical protein